jgi:uncharacterized phage protein (TIGR02218 family)
MKIAAPALQNLILSGQFSAWQIYQIALSNGQTLYLTNADFDIRDANGNLYSCGSYGSRLPKIDAKSARVTSSIKAGLDPDQWQVHLLLATEDPFTGSFYPDLVGDLSWTNAISAGLFDGATVLVQNAYFANVPTVPLTKVNCTPVGTTIEFSGPLGQIDVAATVAVMTFTGWSARLSQMMPRNLYQSSCRHQLFDARCGLSASSFANSGTALAGSTASLLVATPPTPIGSGSYQLGRIVMTSSANKGFQRLISSWDGISNFQFLYPFPFPIAAGDSFTIYPGCDKSLGSGGCGGFANKLNFGGEPYIPLPELQLG